MNNIVYVGEHALMWNVDQHIHESWELIYCTQGSGAFRFSGQELPYREGEVVVIPPMLSHSNASEEGFRNIHINLREPLFSFREPLLVRDDSNRFLLDAFRAALTHYTSSHPERTALLSAYGNLICACLVAYQTTRRHTAVVDMIEREINQRYGDCAFELDTYLKGLPFSYEYLRKLFQKEIGLTPHQYMQRKRLQIASELLLSAIPADGSVADVARACGFHDPLYFSRMFKKHFGISPSRYAETMEVKTLRGEDIRLNAPVSPSGA